MTALADERPFALVQDPTRVVGGFAQATTPSPETLADVLGAPRPINLSINEPRRGIKRISIQTPCPRFRAHA